MIKVSEPILKGNEKKYLCQAIDQGEISSQGAFVKRFEEAFAKWSGNKYAVAVNTGTSALECAIWSLKVSRIAIPNYTIISCPVAAIRAGALPLFYEGEVENLCVMRCHLFGCFNNKVNGVFTVDDASQYWKPFHVDTIAAYSLYANKLITSGEGGIVVTNDEKFYKKVISYRDFCRTEERFIHYDIGYNFRMSNLQAAVALAQLEQIDSFVAIKQKNRDLYKKHMPDGVDIQFDTEVPWMYIIKTPNDAGEMVKKMYAKGVDCRRHFAPLHSQPCFRKYTIGQGPFYISEELWEKSFYLPSGLNLKEEDIAHVCGTLREVLRSF